MISRYLCICMYVGILLLEKESRGPEGNTNQPLSSVFGKDC